MNRKEVLRKSVAAFLVINVLSGFILILQGEIAFFSLSGICVLLAVAIWGFVLIITIIAQIKFLKQYRIGKDYFDYLQEVHKKRYQAYFPYNKEKVDEYSADIEKFGNDFLVAGYVWLAKRPMTKRRRKELLGMMDKTRELMNNVAP